MGDQRERLGERLSRAVGEKEGRKVQARLEKHRTVWFGFQMFGVIGWAVAVPTVVATLLGIWLDRVAPAQFSWTLTLIVLGVLAGCIMAGVVLSKQNRQIHTRVEKTADDDD